MATGQNNSADLLVKYNKLATEFAKLRAQLPVLKRAVVEEQSKNLDLGDVLQGRDQSIRKLEQEVDSLNFRNKQLEKRIGVLQNELTEVTSKAKPKKGTTGHGQSSSSVPDGTSSSLDYELVSKIEENMILQKQLADLEQSSRFEIETLQSQLESLQNEETHKELILDELTELKSDNKSLTFALQNSLDEIEAYKEQVCQMKEKIATPTHHPTPVQIQQSQESSIDQPTTSSSSISQINNEQVKKEDSQESNMDNDNISAEPALDAFEKLRLSEQEKEYWSLEYQLLKMKYDRVAKKWDESKEILRSIGREDLLQIGSSEVTTPVVDLDAANFLGKMEVIGSDGSSDVDITSRSFEREIKECMSKKINELVALLQHADSRAVHFYNECKAMQSLLTLACDKRHTLQEEVETWQTKEVALKEELDLTKESYENKLTQLSEHLALMNDKIAEKQELINEMQAKLKSKK